MMSDSEIKSTVFPLRCSGVVVEDGMKSMVITNPIVNSFFIFVSPTIFKTIQSSDPILGQKCDVGALYCLKAT